MSLKRSTGDPGLILGYTTRRHLLLDLDNSTVTKTVSLVRQIMREWPKVGDCLILRSSVGRSLLYIRYSRMGRPLLIYKRDNFHMVFDNGIGYNLCCRICRVLAEIGILNRDYVRIREFRGDMTLRVGPANLIKGFKPIPSYVCYVVNKFGTKRDGYTSVYADALRIARDLFSTDHDPEDETNQGEDGPDDRRKQPAVEVVMDGPDL